MIAAGRPVGRVETEMGLTSCQKCTEARVGSTLAIEDLVVPAASVIAAFALVFVTVRLVSATNTLAEHTKALRSIEERRQKNDLLERQARLISKRVEVARSLIGVDSKRLGDTTSTASYDEATAFGLRELIASFQPSEGDQVRASAGVVLAAINKTLPRDPAVFSRREIESLMETFTNLKQQLTQAIPDWEKALFETLMKLNGETPVAG